MSESDDLDVQPTKTRPLGGTRLEGASIRIITEKAMRTQSLPDVGDLVIGRGSGADIAIDDDSISKRHALLRIGETITIEDLGSSNGTRVHALVLAPGRSVEVQAGEPIDVGPVLTTPESVSPGSERWALSGFDRGCAPSLSRSSSRSSSLA